MGQRNQTVYDSLGQIIDEMELVEEVNKIVGIKSKESLSASF